MQRREVEVRHEPGMDGPAAAEFARLAGRFQSNVSVARSGRKVNGKSLMGLMMLAAAQGSRLVVEADGPDEIEALDALAELVRDDFRRDGAAGAT
jgi:phosphocarrier protein